MKQAVTKLEAELGLLGIAALGVLAAATAFSMLATSPLEERAQRLDRELDVAARRATPDGFRRVGTDSRADAAAQFYRHFDRKERIDDWLAKIYAAAIASGLELRTGDYRLPDSRQRIDRYQINLPVAGSYAQIRAFLQAALLEVPVLSLDQASFRREGANEDRIEAHIVLTLHLLRK